MSQLRLHGMRRQSVLESRDLETVAENFAATQISGGDKNKDGGHQWERKGSNKTKIGDQSLWKRRHSLVAAKKNTDWADLYLSTAATENSIAGFLSLKNPKDLDAEYFYTFVPKVVVVQDILYKELLAVYNAIHFWGPTLMKGRKILLAIGDDTASDLLKESSVSQEVGPKKILMLKEINDLCKKHDVELRIADLETDPEDMAVYSLVRSNEKKIPGTIPKTVGRSRIFKRWKLCCQRKTFPAKFCLNF